MVGALQAAVQSWVFLEDSSLSAKRSCHPAQCVYVCVYIFLMFSHSLRNCFLSLSPEITLFPPIGNVGDLPIFEGKGCSWIHVLGVVVRTWHNLLHFIDTIILLHCHRPPSQISAQIRCTPAGFCSESDCAWRICGIFWYDLRGVVCGFYFHLWGGKNRKEKIKFLILNVSVAERLCLMQRAGIFCKRDCEWSPQDPTSIQISSSKTQKIKMFSALSQKAFLISPTQTPDRDWGTFQCWKIIENLTRINCPPAHTSTAHHSLLQKCIHFHLTKLDPSIWIDLILTFWRKLQQRSVLIVWYRSEIHL